MHGALAQSRVSLARWLNNKTLIAAPFAGAIIIRYADQFHVIVVYNAHLRPHGISRRKHSAFHIR
jgi:protein-arginine kinase